MCNVHGYGPVPTLDPLNPDDLLKFTSYNFHSDFSNQGCSCRNNGAPCISESGEDILETIKASDIVNKITSECYISI